MSKQDKHRKYIEQRVKSARHMSNPDSENAIVFRANGRWLFEVYPGARPRK